MQCIKVSKYKSKKYNKMHKYFREEKTQNITKYEMLSRRYTASFNLAVTKLKRWLVVVWNGTQF